MEAYSLDLREWICAACDEGLETRAEVAERFGVGRWFVQKLLRQRRVEGTIAAKPRGRGKTPATGVKQQRRLCQLVQNKPDATLAELCQQLHQAEAVQVRVPTMCRALQALRLPLEKGRCTPRNVRRRGWGHYGGTGRSGLGRWRRRSGSSWTRAASTPP